MIKKYLALITLCVLCLGACSKSEADTNKDKATESKSKNTQAESTVAQKNEQIFEITGYREIGEYINETKTACLTGEFRAQKKLGDKYVYSINIVNWKEDGIVVEYRLGDVESEEEFWSGDTGKIEWHIALLSPDTYEIKKDIAFDGYNGYTVKMKDAIAVRQMKDDTITIVMYDFDLNEKGKLLISSDANDYLTSDGRHCYYIYDRQLFVHDFDNPDKKDETVTSKDDYFVNSINGIGTKDGEDYIILQGMAADYNEYIFILNATAKKLIGVYDNYDFYAGIENDIYVEYIDSGSYYNSMMYSAIENRAYIYGWDDESLYYASYVLDNGDLMYAYRDEEKYYFEIFDTECGKMVAATSLDCEKMCASPDEVDKDLIVDGLDYCEDIVYPDISCEPICTGEESLLVFFRNIAGKEYYVTLDYEIADGFESKLQVEEYETGRKAKIDICQFDNPLYYPKELSKEWDGLRDKADDIEEMYGIEIYIGSECGDCLRGYVAKPLEDQELTNQIFSILEQEMAKYPDGFFEQLCNERIKETGIYLASDLTSISEENLDMVSGFKYLDGDCAKIYLDCNDIGIESTIHHELSHVIDELVADAMREYETPLYLDEEWDKLNDVQGIYLYSYTEDRNIVDDSYLYMYCWFTGDVSNVYYVDNYSLTYATEDRARIFESVMSDASFDIDFNQTPHLRDKLNYYAECIRDSFDTTGWENVLWERYMEIEQ